MTIKSKIFLYPSQKTFDSSEKLEEKLYMPKHGLKIRKIIEESGDKLEEVSEAINVHSSTIASWYNLEYPPLDGIKKICDFYRITLWQFFIDDLSELKAYFQDFIGSEDAAMLKLVNTKMDVEQRKLVKEAFLSIVKTVIVKDKDKYKNLPEFKELFGKD